MYDFLNKKDEELASEQICMRRFIHSRPSWDRFAFGVWDIPALAYDPKILKETGIHVPLPKEQQPKPKRWKPSIHFVCERLLDHKLPVTTALKIYQEAIEMLLVYDVKEDFFSLASYRQYLPLEDLKHDKLFFACMRDRKKTLTAVDWQGVARRLPAGSRIARDCLSKTRTEQDK
ncbi:MAG: hypothetical protein ABA06_01265 [Parcubacteria bacterium C7867-001]|nr:MAG: hypothetical protein ABA06_01265 [Parcubacteria bacterium C7867-001]